MEDFPSCEGQCQRDEGHGGADHDFPGDGEAVLVEDKLGKWRRKGFAVEVLRQLRVFSFGMRKRDLDDDSPGPGKEELVTRDF